MEPDNPQAQAPLTGVVLPPPGAPQGPMNPLAVISLVLGVAAICLSLGSVLCTMACCAWLPAVALGILFGGGAAICGHLGLNQMATSGGHEAGRGMAIAGLVTGYVGIGLGLLVIVLMLVIGGAILAGAAGEPLWRSTDGSDM